MRVTWRRHAHNFISFPIGIQLKPSPYLSKSCGPKHIGVTCVVDHMLFNESCVSCDMISPCHFQFLTPALPIQSLWHFCWVPMMTNKGCLLWRPQMLEVKIKRKFCPKICQILAFQGFGGYRLVTESDGGWKPEVGRKSKKVTDSHRKDMSPLTQGLNYRSACD